MISPKRSSLISSCPPASSANSAPGSEALPRLVASRRKTSSACSTASACNCFSRPEMVAATALPCCATARQRDCRRLNSMPCFDVIDGAFTSDSSLCACRTGSSASVARRCSGSSSSTGNRSTEAAAVLAVATRSSASCTMSATSRMICGKRDCLSSEALACTLSNFSLERWRRPSAPWSSLCSKPCAVCILPEICAMVDPTILCKSRRLFSSSTGGFLSRGQALLAANSRSAPASVSARLLETSARDLSTSIFSSNVCKSAWNLARSSSM
mmetsp:Transcript_6287/g.17139  ORF Transcript_6287/g.17139 Transcript_6287/m.17139 type:complete len:271 (+) Transcript_6287:1754-2566(+)